AKERTLETFRMPFEACLYLEKKSSVASLKIKRAFLLPPTEAEEKGAMETNERKYLILVDDHTINHPRVACPDKVDTNRNADSDSRSHRIFIENLATPGHISDRLAEAIANRAAGFSQNDRTPRSVFRDRSRSFRSGRCCGCFRNLSPCKRGHNCQRNA